MSIEGIRLECLKMAMEHGGTIEEIIVNAAALFAFILEGASPSSTS